MASIDSVAEGFNVTFSPIAVPEPSTLMLLGTCLFGLGFMRKKGRW